MTGLIKRLEAASGPSFTLEQEIFRAVNPNATKLSVPNNYTSSIDAALTLVPPDWFLTLTGVNDSWHAMLNETAHGKRGLETGFSSTSALAICIAALKARGVQ